MGSDAHQVEVVLINWKRPQNVGDIVRALRDQTVPCTITICDCHDSPQFQLDSAAVASADRIYRWRHNLGSFSRYVPAGAYDHKYTFFIDDDMIPGARCVEHFLAWAEYLRAFGALGQLGRILDADGLYHSRNVARGPSFTEVDVLVRAFFVRTDCLAHVQQIRSILEEESDPEDDILLSVGLALYAGLGCYLTPADPDRETLVNTRELASPHARSHRPTHLQVRAQLLQNAIALGWRPVRARQHAGPGSRGHGTPDERSGVLYLAIGENCRMLTTASVSALRRYGYRGPVRVVTDKPGWLPAKLGCESVLVPEVGEGFAARHYKTQLFQFAYDTTLFLDADAIPIGNIEGIWKYLAGADIAMAADLRPNVGDLITRDKYIARWGDEFSLMIRLGLTGRTFFNSGVMLFRKSDTVAELFATWHQEWERFRGRDQLALVRATALTGSAVRTMPIVWNCPAREFASVRAAQDAGIKVLHFFSTNRIFMTAELVWALGDEDRYPPGGDWEEWDLRGRERLRVRTGGAGGPAYRPGLGGGFVTQTATGASENLEMALPGAQGGVESYWRQHDTRDLSWHGPVVVGQAWGTAGPASLVQGSLGDQGNLELVMRVQEKLGHYWRRPSPKSPWQGPRWFAHDISGNPSFIQADDGLGGSFELVVPHISGGVAHYRRNNYQATRPWMLCAVFASELGRVDAVALIQSTLGRDSNLEVIVRAGDRLAHYWKPLHGQQRWHGPVFFFTGAAGIPGFIQGRRGTGNFEVLSPVQHGGMVHLSRDNCNSHRQWRASAYIDYGMAQVEAVSLIQADNGDTVSDNLEAVAVSDTEVKWYWQRDTPPGKWSSTLL
jgi:hypothetical protein